MMTLAGLMITLMSWCIDGERLYRVHDIGMAFILIAITLMGVFQESVAFDKVEISVGHEGLQAL